MAHELGHVLYDPAGRLNDLRVDRYDELNRAVEEVGDAVEQRANAFAVEFLAPQSAVREFYESDPGRVVSNVMDEYGISYTAARYQIWNAIERAVPLESLTAERRPPDNRWRGPEAYTVDFHPLRQTRPSRAGRFSAVVVRAAAERVVSWDTAAEWLEASVEDVQHAAPRILDLYKGVAGSAEKRRQGRRTVKRTVASKSHVVKSGRAAGPRRKTVGRRKSKNKAAK